MLSSVGLNWVFFVIGLVLILAELFVGIYTGFDLVLIGVSFLVGALVGYFVPVPTVIIGVTLVILIGYLIFGRSFIKKRLYIVTHKSNIDALIGKQAVVIRAIKPMHPGQVKVDGEVWRASSDTRIDQGDKIEIVGIEGVTLKVKKITHKEVNK